MSVARRGVRFDERLDGVADLGMDPTGREPIDDALAATADRPALVELPPGTYLVEEPLTHDFRRWGLRGLGDSRRDVRVTVPEGTNQRVFDCRDVADVVVENLTFDQTAPGTSIGNVLRGPRNINLYDVELAGFEREGIKDLSVRTTHPEGVAHVERFVRVGGTAFVDYPGNSMCFHAGPDHRGTLDLHDCWIENAGSNAVYASRTTGSVRVRGGLYRNCQPTHLRVAGADSLLADATVVVDTDAPDFREDNDGTLQNARGIWNESGGRNEGFPHRAGPPVRNVDLVYRSCPNASGVYVAHPDGGGHVLEDVRIHAAVAADVIRTEPYEGPEDVDPTVTFRGLSITGDLPADHPVVTANRPETVLHDARATLPRPYRVDGDPAGGFEAGRAARASAEPTWVHGVDPRAV